jgi:hypothetical protein
MRSEYANWHFLVAYSGTGHLGRDDVLAAL